jgi:hypothetical protein
VSLYDDIKAKARASMEAFIASGMHSKKALEAVQAQYVEDVVAVMASEINALKIGTITPTRLKKMALGDIDLSTNLYRHTQQVNAAVLQEINRHTVQLHKARDLALKIYEGYNFNPDELLDVKKTLPRYLFDPIKQMNAKQLKTPSLKAAYLKTLEANNEQDLKKALEVAMYERNRFFANRIAQTELHRIQTQAKVKGMLRDDGIEVIQIRLSITHPKVDICDYHANLDAYGLGAGCYPKDRAPLPPYHPFCKCIVAPRLDLSLSGAKRVEGDPEKGLMRQFSVDEQAMIVGSKGMLAQWQGGRGDVVSLVDRTKNPLYRTRYTGDVAANPLVPDLKGNELLALKIRAPDKTTPMLDVGKFEDWYKSAKAGGAGRFIVGYVSASMAKRMNANSNNVLMSEETAVKQLKEHPDLTVRDYTILNAIETADAMVSDGMATLLFFYVSNNMYKIAIKTTRNKELMLTTMHKVGMPYFRSATRRGKVIFNNIELDK